MKQFTHKINEKINSDIWLSIEPERRSIIVDLLYFMDNLGQQHLYENGINVRVVKTQKLDLGFVLLSEYEQDNPVHNELISGFLERNRSYWAYDDGELKLNSKLILENRKPEIQKILKYYLKEQKEFFI